MKHTNATLLHAYNTFTQFAAALINPLLSLKVAKILQELKVVVEPYSGVMNSLVKDYVEYRDKAWREEGAILVNNKWELEDKKKQGEVEFMIKQEEEKVNKKIDELSKIECDFALKAPKLSQAELADEKNFRQNHNFNFAMLPHILDFVE